MHLGVFNLITDFSASWVPTWTQHEAMLAPKIHENLPKTSFRGCPKSIAFWDPFSSDFGPILAAYLAPSWCPGDPKTAPKTAQEPPETAPDTFLSAPGTQVLGFYWIFWKQELRDLPKSTPGPSKINQILLTFWETKASGPFKIDPETFKIISKLLPKSSQMTLVQLYVGYLFQTFGLFKTIWW